MCNSPASKGLLPNLTDSELGTANIQIGCFYPSLHRIQWWLSEVHVYLHQHCFHRRTIPAQAATPGSMQRQANRSVEVPRHDPKVVVWVSATSQPKTTVEQSREQKDFPHQEESRAQRMAASGGSGFLSLLTKVDASLQPSSFTSLFLRQLHLTDHWE